MHNGCLNLKLVLEVVKLTKILEESLDLIEYV